MPKKKKLVPNSGKSISEIQQLPGNTYTAEGVSSLTFAKHYEYFKDINCIYSEEYPEGKMLELLHIVLYCRFKSFQSNGAKCYESQGRLGQIFRSDPGTIGDKIKDLADMGLVRKDPNPDPNCDTLVYTALDITDAHVIPPDQLPAAPIIVSDEKPHQPEPTLIPESETIVEHPVPDWDDIPCVWDEPGYLEPPSPTMTNVAEDAVFVEERPSESVMEDDVIVDRVCRLLSHRDSLRQSQRYDTFIAYARRVLERDGEQLQERIEGRLEERFEQLHPHLYSRFEIPC